MSHRVVSLLGLVVVSNLWSWSWFWVVTRRASCGACIVIGPVSGFMAVFVCLWVCYHDNSKLRASILTKLGLYLLKVVTISSWLNFGRPAPPGRGSAAGRIFLAPPYYSQRAVFASLWALFSLVLQRDTACVCVCVCLRAVDDQISVAVRDLWTARRSL